MTYHILEIRKTDEEGHILLSEFYVIDEAGNIVDGPFNGLQLAINRLRELEYEDEYKPSTSSP